jgi:hypothetical protein
LVTKESRPDEAKKSLETLEFPLIVQIEEKKTEFHSHVSGQELAQQDSLHE